MDEMYYFGSYFLFRLFFYFIASLKVCADGGANQLFEYAHRKENFQKLNYIPDYIIGDFDSLNDDVRSFYAEKVPSLKLGFILKIIGRTNYSC